MQTALLSAYEKAGVTEFAAELRRLDFNLLASGGTAKCIRDSGTEVTDIATIVGEPILGHRVVTLSRQIHAALLARDNPEDNAELQRIGMPRIDLLYVDLYPLKQAIEQHGQALDPIFEMIDVGGPAMLMAGVKGRRIVVCDPTDLIPVANALRRIKDTPDTFSINREHFWWKASQTVARYYVPLEQLLVNFDID